MAQDFFRIYRGLELDDTVQYLQGSGAPGAAGDTSLAPVGSAYLDNLTGDFWTKITAGVGTGHWSKMASESWVNNTVSSQISWREPVTVIDTTTTTVPSGAGADTIDGVTIPDGGRVLFSAATPANVYIYDALTETYTQDVNALSQGDTVYVDGGTNGGTRWTYNGTQWVRFDSSSLDELGYIRSFIGKTAAGAVMPNYTSTLVVTSGIALDDAISQLDAELGAHVSTGNFISAFNALNVNVQAIDTELGANVTNGNYILAATKMNGNIQALDTALGAPTGTGHWISDAQHVNGNLLALDTEIGANVANGNWILAANTVNQNITALDFKLGPAVSTGNYITNSFTAHGNIQALDTALGSNVVDGNFILASDKINDNIQSLDAEIGANVTDGTYILHTNTINQNLQSIDTELSSISKEVTTTGVTTTTVMDTIAATVVKWIVKAVDSADSSNVYAAEVFAATNGLTVDMTKFAVLKMGSPISGLVFDVTRTGANLQLTVTSTASVDVTTKRVSSI